MFSSSAYLLNAPNVLCAHFWDLCAGCARAPRLCKYVHTFIFIRPMYVRITLSLSVYGHFRSRLAASYPQSSIPPLLVCIFFY